MRVLELWRYPVKSLQGERLAEAEIGALGIAGDRRWALFDRDTGLGLTARRVPELLFGVGPAPGRTAASRWCCPTARSPPTTRSSPTGWAAGWSCGPPTSDGDVAPTYETPADEDVPDPTEWLQWEGATGPFHDSPRIRLSLVSTGTLGTWDRRRFRANVVLDGAGEDGLRGRGGGPRRRCGCGSACPSPGAS